MRSFITAVAIALTLVTTGALAGETCPCAPAYMPLRAAVVLPSGWDTTRAVEYVGPNLSKVFIENRILHVKGVMYLRGGAPELTEAENAEGDKVRADLRAAFNRRAQDLYHAEDGETSMVFAYSDMGRRHVLRISTIGGNDDTGLVIIVDGPLSVDTMKVAAALEQLSNGVVIP